MLSVKGRFENGVARPARPVKARDGSDVIITFLEKANENEKPEAMDADWDALIELIDRCQVDAGIQDLAHQHEHYLYGVPKQE
jgi:hypothetical protein